MTGPCPFRRTLRVAVAMCFAISALVLIGHVDLRGAALTIRVAPPTWLELAAFWGLALTSAALLIGVMTRCCLCAGLVLLAMQAAIFQDAMLSLAVAGTLTGLLLLIGTERPVGSRPPLTPERTGLPRDWRSQPPRAPRHIAWANAPDDA